MGWKEELLSLRRLASVWNQSPAFHAGMQLLLLTNLSWLGAAAKSSDGGIWHNPPQHRRAWRCQSLAGEDLAGGTLIVHISHGMGVRGQRVLLVLLSYVGGEGY